MPMKHFHFKPIGTALAVATAIIINNAAHGKMPRKSDRLRNFRSDNIWAKTVHAAQPNRAIAPCTPEVSQQVRYRIVDLGENGIGNEIADSGWIVGSHGFGDSDRHAALWLNSHLLPIDLGTLANDIGSRGFGINARGQMVGYSRPPARATFWASSQSTPIELPGLPDGFSYASAINSAGHIVGQFIDGDETSVSPIYWANSNTPAAFLAEVSDDLPFGVAFSINAGGNIVGDACSADFSECHIAYWANSGSTAVALASPEGEFINTDAGLSSDFSIAHILNNGGKIVGFAYNADGSETRGVFWASSGSTAVILNTSEEFSNGTAESINDNGQIVGTAYNSDFSDNHAFVWLNSDSQGVDLNTVIPSNSGWVLNVARSINNRGEITAAGEFNGTQHACVLIPVPGRQTN